MLETDLTEIHMRTARAAMNAFVEASGDHDDDDSAVVDLITNLYLMAEQDGHDIDAIQRMVANHIEVERGHVSTPAMHNDETNDVSFGVALIDPAGIDFDAVEVHPVEQFIDATKTRNCQPITEDEIGLNPECRYFWSVYLHLREGGVECHSDHATKDAAMEQANAISVPHHNGD